MQSVDGPHPLHDIVAGTTTRSCLATESSTSSSPPAPRSPEASCSRMSGCVRHACSLATSLPPKTVAGGCRASTASSSLRYAPTSRGTCSAGTRGCSRRRARVWAAAAPPTTSRPFSRTRSCSAPSFSWRCFSRRTKPLADCHCRLA
jgi:hypothetical protein